MKPISNSPEDESTIEDVNGSEEQIPDMPPPPPVAGASLKPPTRGQGSGPARATSLKPPVGTLNNS